MTTAACVLISRDSGATWKASGDIEDARTWLVNPTLEEGSKGQLIMMFRTSTGEAPCMLMSSEGLAARRTVGGRPLPAGGKACRRCRRAGRTYMSSSADKGVTWSRPTYNSLPNPNSPFSTVTIDGQVLCVFNNSQTIRAPLALALSVNDCKSWEPLAMVEEDATGESESAARMQQPDPALSLQGSSRDAR